MNTKSIVARVAAFARSKKGAALLLLACTAGEGNGGLTWAMQARRAPASSPPASSARPCTTALPTASKTLVAKQNQSVSAGRRRRGRREVSAV